MNNKYDVIVIGGGHSGVEAAAAVARMGLKIAIVTFSKNNIGEMSCNPSIGGLGKGHLVREIDALDGIMGRAIDKAGTHFRMLNSSKGAAVQGLRAQADRKLYKKAVMEILNEYENLTIIEDEVLDLKIDDNKVTGVVLKIAGEVDAGAIVVATGTFLNGIMHCGEEKKEGGRIGENSSKGITESLKRAGFLMYRLKTGTPARLLKSTINYDILEEQPSDENSETFSYLTTSLPQKKISCYITNTNEKTHQILFDNKDRTPLYNGQIKSIGPRYCPSIEDKVVRFRSHPSHHIFLEEEGYDCDVVYPNGISTSLPADVQEKFIHTIVGLENVKILQYGYAIEYDAIDPRQLMPTLSSKKIKGLYFAGQINGTSGYEEAAAQGIVAGINAALFVKGDEEIVIDRSEGYIGVLIDDITTLGVDEPYRMFTARSEYRISIRQDNADQRLTPIGIKVGCVGEKRKKFFNAKMQKLQSLKNLLLNTKITKKMLIDMEIDEYSIAGLDGYNALRYSEFDIKKLAKIVPEINNFEEKIILQIQIEGKYQGYLKRQEQDIMAYKKDQALKIPVDLDYSKIGGLNLELRAKLDATKPTTLAAAARIPGITPAALTCLLKYVKRS